MAPSNSRWPLLGVLLAFCLPLFGLPFATASRAGPHWELVRGLGAPGAVRQMVSSQANGQAALYVLVERWGIFRCGDDGSWVAASGLARQHLGQLAAGTLAVSPADPQLLLVGIAEGPRLYRTEDGGRSWVPRRGLSVQGLEALAMGPGSTVYATGGSRLALSADGGDTWLETGSRPSASRVLALAADAATGRLYAGTLGDGLWLTADQGASWSAALPGRSILCIATASSSLIYAGADDGLYASADGGASWQALPGTVAGTRVEALAVAPGSPQRVFVAMVGCPLQRSEDGGASWQALPELPAGPATALAVDPAHGRYLYAGSAQGLWRLELGQ